ncbi:hypothetical protein NUSPORA_00392 [Nucleospora cyclopteri]
MSIQDFAQNGEISFKDCVIFLFILSLILLSLTVYEKAKEKIKLLFSRKKTNTIKTADIK